MAELSFQSVEMIIRLLPLSRHVPTCPSSDTVTCPGVFMFHTPPTSRVVISAQGNGVGPNLKQNLSRTPSHLSRTILGLIHVMRSHPPDKCHAINFFTTFLGTNLDLLGCYKTQSKRAAPVPAQMTRDVPIHLGNAGICQILIGQTLAQRPVATGLTNRPKAFRYNSGFC
ncbi:hypothetical protein J6590_093758 [Homalodisca vitripennis]|nr:hypothetical protein J6590_093758 [Homalodisca vitripennis]